MRRALLLTAALGLAIGGIVVGLVVAGALAEDDSQVPPGKQTAEAIETHQQATAVAGPREEKTPDVTPVGTPRSWPVDPSNYSTRITAPIYGPPRDYPHIFGERGKPRLSLTSQARGLTTNGAPFTIFAGALRSDPQQGVIVVLLGAKDPCAEGRLDYDPQEYATPARRGVVTMYEVHGNTVLFRTADGTAGNLDMINGTFGEPASDTTPVPTVAGQ